jgi:hypothetical protein
MHPADLKSTFSIPTGISTPKCGGFSYLDIRVPESRPRVRESDLDTGLTLLWCLGHRIIFTDNDLEFLSFDSDLGLRNNLLFLGL